MFGKLWRVLTGAHSPPVPERDAREKWESEEGQALLARMRAANPALTAEFERGLARRPSPPHAGT